MGSVTLAGKTWDLWTGYNGEMRVYSFVPPSGTIKTFGADVKEFFSYLEKNHQFPSSQRNLIGKLDSVEVMIGLLTAHIAFQVSTEAFTGGPATFTCTQFTAEVV